MAIVAWDLKRIPRLKPSSCPSNKACAGVLKPQTNRQTHRALWAELLFEAFVGIYVVAVVVLCWQRPVWSSVLLCGCLGIQLWFWGQKADAVMMIAAALLGTPSEMVCVKLGVWTYSAPGLVLGIPVWIPLVWASLFCLFRRVSLSTMSVIRTLWPDEKLAGKIFFAALGGLILVYCFITVLFINKTIAMIYTIFLIPAVIFWHGQRDILIFVFGAVFGTLGEYICMKLGFWQYHYPLLRSIGLPISLPLAWGLSAVIIGRIARIWETATEAE